MRPLSRLQSSHAVSGAVSYNSLNDSPRNFSNAFKFDQGPLLEPQSSKLMGPVDQGNLRVFRTRLSHNAESDNSVDTTRKKSFHLRNSRTTVRPGSQQAQSSSTDLPQPYDLRPRLPPRDYLEKVIQNQIPPKVRCIPISETAASSNQLP